MSDSQKMLTSVSGAFVVHLLLLLLVVVLPRANSAASAAALNRAAKSPREVTVDMGELMKRLERERSETEPEKPEEEPKPKPPTSVRPFVATDENRPEASAPANARFESDRNTSAASRLRPDESLPQHATPTLNGTNPLPHLTLANRDHADGPLEARPASPDPVKPSETTRTLPKPPSPAPPADPTMAMPSPSHAAVSTPSPAAPTSAAGPRHDAPVSIQPGRAGVEEVGATREKSYADADARIEAPALPDGDDQAAAGVGSGREGQSAMGDRESDPLSSETKEGQAPRELSTTPSVPTASNGGIKPADEGLFAKGFRPEERQNVLNGSLAKEGADAVDAVDTPVGRYKKAVRDAISAKWHRYRQDHAEFVTWGILKLEFSVDASGQVRDLEIIKNEANAMLAEFSLRAIREATLPPMPGEVSNALGSQGLVIQYDIIIY